MLDAQMVKSNELLAALNIVGLTSLDGSEFQPVATVPASITARFPALGGTSVELAREFPFLATYLEDAESFWQSGADPKLRSGAWTQLDANGDECQLEATAVRSESGTRTLLLEFLGQDFDHLQGILQSAREKSLAMEQLERMQAALNEAHDRLEERVAARTAELTEANRQLVDYQNQLRLLVDQLAIAEERERRRIATYLHDHVGQNLALVRMKLGALLSELTTQCNRDACNTVRELIEATIQETRTLTFDLGSPVLYELGLESALESLANRLKDDHSIATQFSDDGHPKPVSNELRSLLYQAVRELFHNIVKHAHARKVVVSARRVDERIEIVVEDEGVGFDDSTLEFRVTRDGGFGLFNIRERLDHFDGSIDVRSRPGEGTRITLSAPVSD